MTDPAIPQIKEDYRRLRAAMPGKCEIYISIYPEGPSPLHLTMYPEGVTKSRRISVEAADWGSLFAQANEIWAAAAAEHDRQTVRRMALEIIRITAEMGACSDEALRAGDFSSDDVTRFGEQACADANDIAGKGPFSITRIAAISNAA